MLILAQALLHLLHPQPYLKTDITDFCSFFDSFFLETPFAAAPTALNALVKLLGLTYYLRVLLTLLQIEYSRFKAGILASIYCL